MSENTLAPVLRSLRKLLVRHHAEQTTDATLLERFVSTRDGEAFAALVQRHGPMVWGVCRRVLREGHAAEDAFQAAFLVFARKAGSIRTSTSVAGWLYRVSLRGVMLLHIVWRTLGFWRTLTLSVGVLPRDRKAIC